MATDCLACINTRIGTGFQCGWCGASTATCSVSEEFAGGTSIVNWRRLSASSFRKE